MALLPCKCPNCGAELEVDKSNEAAVCKYCNTPFIVEKAINNYNIHNNFAGANIVMEDGISLENLYILARRALKAEKFEEAFNYYHDILKKAPNNWEAVFFVSYCQSPYFFNNNTGLGFPDLAKNNANVITESVKLLKNQFTDENEQIKAIQTLSSYSFSWFSAFQTAFKTNNSAVKIFERETKFIKGDSSLFLDDALGLMAMGYSLGDALENNSFSDNLSNDIKVKAWKRALEINIKTYNSCMDKEMTIDTIRIFLREPEIHKKFKEKHLYVHKKITEYLNGRHIFEYLNTNLINEYVDKVKKYDPNYIPLAFENDIAKENLINKYINKVKQNDPNFIPLTIKENKNGGCYIATCVYGSYDCPEVWTLRRFRDDYLSSMWFGKLFIKFYYLVSPHIVKRFGNNNYFKNTLKPCLDKLVTKLHNNGYRNTPYKDK